MRAAIQVGGNPATNERWHVHNKKNNESDDAHSALEKARFDAAADVDQVQQPQSN